MTPTNEQIIAEAERRWTLAGAKSADYPIFIIEVMREGWTPPEPVDPDILAFREWTIARHPKCETEIKAGKWDHDFLAPPFLAGARMAREQERERAWVLVEYVQADARRLDGVGDRARAAVAKYEAGGQS